MALGRLTVLTLKLLYDELRFIYDELLYDELLYHKLRRGSVPKLPSGRVFGLRHFRLLVDRIALIGV